MNLSIVLPFYHKLEEFKQTLPHNKQFFVEGMELVIPIDEPNSEPALREFLDSQNLPIPYVLKSNMETHEWRNPVKAINVGIKLSTRERIVVMSPETLCVSNLYKELYDRCTLHNFTLGRVGWVSVKSTQRHDIDSLNSLFDSNQYYGSICVFKQSLELIQGYNEAFIKWGADDDDLRKRLRLIHLQELLVENAKALHLEIECTRPTLTTKDISNPNLAIPFSPQPEWGTSF